MGYLSSTLLGVLGIVGSFMVLLGQNANSLQRLPTQEGIFNLVKIPPKNASMSSPEHHVLEITNEEDAKSFLLWLLYVDDVFDKTADKSVQFPLISSTAIITILINALLLYGVFQSKPNYFLPYFSHLLITAILEIIYLFLSSLTWNKTASDILFLCLHPLESMFMLYFSSCVWTGVACILSTILKGILVFDTCRYFTKLKQNQDKIDQLLGKLKLTREINLRLV